MRRWHQDLPRTLRNRQQLAACSPGAVRELGRYRKKHGLDCGKVRCRVCHWDKLMETPKHKDEVAAMRWKEQME